MTFNKKKGIVKNIAFLPRFWDFWELSDSPLLFVISQLILITENEIKARE